MARYGPNDDPNYPDNDPTAYGNYGNGGGYDNGGYDGGGYDEPPEEPQPWYRKPAALVAMGAIGALLIALIVWGLANLISGDDTTTEPTSLTPLTTTSRTQAPTTATSEPETVTETVTPTTTAPPITTTTEAPTTTTTVETSTSVSTSVSTSTETSTVTETITSPPPAP